jgi:hypothetical protein
MNALTLHAMDDHLVLALRRHAADLGTSLNQATKALLAGALGLTSAERRKSPGFMKFAGKISSQDADSLMSFVEKADFSRVSKEDWK